MTVLTGGGSFLITLRYANPRIAANEILKMLNSPCKHFTGRPWNQYEPDDSLWWLVPSTDWPAYKHGKLVFWADSNNIWCGLHVEKGFGPALRHAGFKSIRDHHYLTDEWLWHEILNDMETGVFKEAVEPLWNHVDKLMLSVDGGMARDRDFDPNAIGPDVINFELSKDSLGIKNYKLPQVTLNPILKVSSLPELAKFLRESSKETEWFWINLSILVPLVKPYSTMVDDHLLWDAGQLHDKVLAYMMPWVR